MKTCFFQGKNYPVLDHGTDYKCHTIVNVLTGFFFPQRYIYPSLLQASVKTLGGTQQCVDMFLWNF